MLPSHLRVHGQLLHKDTCIHVKMTLELMSIRPNTPMNILWSHSTLFVLVCDNQAIGKQSSIIHVCPTGSSKFIGRDELRDTW